MNEKVDETLNLFESEEEPFQIGTDRKLTNPEIFEEDE